MVQGSLEGFKVRDILAKLAVILALSISLSFAQLLDKVVANVNGEPILESEVKIAAIFYGIKDREEIIKRLVEKHLIAQFLLEKGLNIPEGYLESVIKDIAKSNSKSVEEFYNDLYKEGLTPEDLKNFLRVEIASTIGLREFLAKKIEVSEIEIELERLRKGEVRFLREVELLVVDKGKKEDLLKLVGKRGADLEGIARSLGLNVERLKVEKGELVEPLDEEIWKVKPGQLAVAEDENNVYLAKVLRVIRVYSGRSEEEIKREIIRRKIEETKRKMLTKLKKQSFIEIYG